MADDPQKPLVERINARLRANPVVAIAIVIGSIVIGIASFTNAASGLIARFSHKEETPASARTALGQLNLPFTADAFVSGAGAGDASAVRLYLKAGMDPNATLADGSTALSAAAFNGRASVVTMLLDGGARIVDASGERSALYSATLARRNDIVKLLLDRHPDREAIDAAFVIAMRRKVGVPTRNDEGARLLAASGADVRRVAPKVFDALWMENRGDADAVVATRMLLELGAVPGDMDGTSGQPVPTMTPLMNAASLGYAATVDLLLANGANVQTRYSRPGRDGDGATALIYAARGGSAAAVRALLARGARTGDRDASGLRAVDYARRAPDRPDSAELVRLLK